MSVETRARPLYGPAVSDNLQSSVSDQPQSVLKNNVSTKDNGNLTWAERQCYVTNAQECASRQ